MILKKLMIIGLLCFWQINLISMDSLLSFTVGCGIALLTGVVHVNALLKANVYQYELGESNTKKTIDNVYQYELGESNTEKIIDVAAVLATSAIAGWKYKQAESFSTEVAIIPAALMAAHIVGRKAWIKHEENHRRQWEKDREKWIEELRAKS